MEKNVSRPSGDDQEHGFTEDRASELSLLERQEFSRQQSQWLRDAERLSRRRSETDRLMESLGLYYMKQMTHFETHRDAAV